MAHPLSMLCARLGLAALAAAWGAHAAETGIAPGQDLEAAIAAAAPGDVLRLAPGDYPGNIVIDKPLTLLGPEDRSARIVGRREGRTVWVKAGDVTLKQLTIRHSGLSLPDMDAGVFLDKTAERARIEDNDIIDNSVGVYLRGARDALVRGNRIVGNTGLRVNERGNGVTVWNAPGSRVLDNDISEGRDGIFSNTSSENVFRGNRFSRLRYAVHYMYTNNSEVSGNVSVGNEIAYAIMFSENLVITDNIAIDSTHQGLMLNAANKSVIEGNVIGHAEKCVFIYNANFNRIAGNHFHDCQIGVHYTAGAQGNAISANAFVNNQNQVKYVGTRYLEWSAAGRGNYWSGHSAFDLDGDGIGDTAYRPNDIIDQVLWRAPGARLLLNSPAVSIVRWAQSQFPAILPGGVLDSAPLMAMPRTAAWEKYKDLP